MMRMTFSSCVLLLVVVSPMAFGQQATPVTTTRVAPQVEKKSATAQSADAKGVQTKATHHRSATGKRSKGSTPKRAKRPAYRPEYTQNSVEVMNGASTQKIVFHDDKGTSESTKGTRAGTNAPAPLRVEVVNGTASDTEYFYGDNGRQGSDEKRPVVVAIQSSDTRVVGGNKHTVVTGITAVGRGDAKSANGSGQKVTAVVSPQPKRPEYQPDAH
jgi:hypothetical protein